MKGAPYLNLVLSVVLVACLGWLLYLGKALLVPIITAVICVYVLVSLTEALERIPPLGALPQVILRLIILILFTLVLLLFAFVVADTVGDISRVVPTYQANFEAMIERAASAYHLEAQELIDEIRSVTIDRMDVQALLLRVLGEFTSIGASVFLVVVYSGFLMSERGSLARKISAAMSDEHTAQKTLRVIKSIDKKVSDYLAIKTLINVIIGAISFVILWIMDVDFALFWALLIGLLNYIPYVGSYMGVAFPVLLSLAQFGNLATTAVLLALLTSAQIFVGNFLEPRMIGRQLNLSPFVVLVALSLWASLWGVPGAILAVPLTSIIAIILDSFDETRFLAVLIAEKIDEPEEIPDDRTAP